MIRWVVAFGILAGLVGALIFLESCVPQPKFPAYCYAAKAFKEAHEACSSAATTRAESEACGVALDRSCGVAP